MKKTIALSLLLVGASVVASAAATPEIDPASGASALALLAGALVIFQGRRKR